jgi:protein ImuB
MAELLSERLAPLVLPQPVRNVRLLSGPLIDLQADATELFAHDRRESGENLPQLVERLRARLGNGAVHALACVPEHRPEAAWRAVEPTATKPRARQQASSRSAAPNASSPAVPLPWRGERSAARPGEGRPLWLLDRPEPCDVDRLVLEEGPECIESGWWDGHDVARDYYIARNAQGARLWVFRKRRETTAGARWFLHGWFA